MLLTDKVKNIFSGLLVLVTVCSCSNKQKTSENVYKSNIYAKGFAIKQMDSCRVVEVINPWDSTQILHKYILVDKDKKVPSILPKGDLVRTPVQQIIASSSIDVAILEELGELESVVGCCDAIYLTKESNRKRVESGDIVDLGSARKLSAEIVISLAPDLIFASPFKGQDYGSFEKVNTTIAEVASYTEQLPLGRCEWIKFYAEFYNKKDIADSIFNDVTIKYNDIKNRVAKVEKRPKLLVEKRYGNVWYAPAGGSYAVNLYTDAGADYIWKDTKGIASLALSFEEVFSKAHDAEFWLFRYYNTQGNITYNFLENEYSQYSMFEAFKKKNIFCCNTAKIEYYSSVILRPDMELENLAKIFHPELFENLDMSYYSNIIENE